MANAVHLDKLVSFSPEPSSDGGYRFSFSARGSEGGVLAIMVDTTDIKMNEEGGKGKVKIDFFIVDLDSQTEFRCNSWNVAVGQNDVLTPDYCGARNYVLVTLPANSSGVPGVVVGANAMLAVK